jgi:ribosomal protein L40E
MGYWTDKEFSDVVKNSKTITEVLRCFGVPVNQGYHNRAFHRDIDRLGLDTSHFSRPKPKNDLPLDEILIEKSKWKGGSKNLRIKLVKYGVIDNVCSECGIGPEWNGKRLTLQLDHINGDSSNNRLENLRILCPNCHTQTITHSRNKTNRTEHICSRCGAKHPTKSKLCRPCSNAQNAKHKINWPTNAKLKRILRTKSYTQVGRELGVSDNAIRKRLNR